MTAGLLERDAELRRLRETLRGAGRGRGSVVLVSGEAGIGKTVLVRRFAREAATQARVLVGACDDLVAPRTLGPFRDMARARDAAGTLAEAVEPGAGREAVFGAVLEFPQSGERFEGKASFTAWRQQYPARLDFEPRELRGGGDLWVAETGLRYDGSAPLSVVKILQFRGDRIQRETLYFADPFPAPDWRRPWAAEGAPEQRRGDLPAHIAAGQ